MQLEALVTSSVILTQPIKYEKLISLLSYQVPLFEWPISLADLAFYRYFVQSEVSLCWLFIAEICSRAYMLMTLNKPWE